MILTYIFFRPHWYFIWGYRKKKKRNKKRTKRNRSLRLFPAAFFSFFLRSYLFLDLIDISFEDIEEKDPQIIIDQTKKAKLDELDFSRLDLTDWPTLTGKLFFFALKKICFSFFVHFFVCFFVFVFWFCSPLFFSFSVLVLFCFLFSSVFFCFFRCFISHFFLTFLFFFLIFSSVPIAKQLPKIAILDLSLNFFTQLPNDIYTLKHVVELSVTGPFHLLSLSLLSLFSRPSIVFLWK